jgi:hypothetical protein
MRRVFVAFLWLMGLANLAACTSYVPPPFTGEPTPARPPEEAWARVLKNYVDEQGRVDFAGLAANSADLERYVAWIYERSPDRWPDLYPTRKHVAAYHLNAYNALAMYNLLGMGVPKELSLLKRAEFFDKRQMFVGGEPLTLADYRERVVQGLGDPRVHFALTSLLAGDPRLSREPFRSAGLDQQLDRAARRFFADERNLRVDERRRAIVLSPILRDHAAEFLKAAPSLPAYASDFRDRALPEDYAVEFAEFDWTVRRAGSSPQ